MSTSYKPRRNTTTTGSRLLDKTLDDLQSKSSARKRSKDSAVGDVVEIAPAALDAAFNFFPSVEIVDPQPSDAASAVLTEAGTVVGTDRHSWVTRREMTPVVVVGSDSAAGVHLAHKFWIKEPDEELKTHSADVGAISSVAGTSGGKLWVLGSKGLRYFTADGKGRQKFDIERGEHVAVFPSAAPVVATDRGALLTLNSERELEEIVGPIDGGVEHLAVTGRSTIVAINDQGIAHVFDRSGKQLGELDLGGPVTSLTTIGAEAWAAATDKGELVFGAARGAELARRGIDWKDATISGTTDGRLYVGAPGEQAEIWAYPSAAEIEKLSAEKALDPAAAKAAKAELARGKKIGELTARAETLVDEIRGDLSEEIQGTFDLNVEPDFAQHAQAAFEAAWPKLEKKLKAALTRKKADKAILDDTPAVGRALDQADWQAWVGELVPDLTGGELFDPPMPAPFQASGATVPERRHKADLIGGLVARDAAADERDQRRLEQILDTLSVPMLEALASTDYTITVARHRITNAEQDLAGKVNGNGGVAVMADLAEGVHRGGGKEPSRITVRSYWKNGEIQIDAGTLLHEIGHAFDQIEAGKGGSLNVEPQFADAFGAEHQRLDPYFHVQAEFFAEVFAYYMLDPERCERQFPRTFAAFDKKFRFERPNTRKIHALQNEMRGEISVNVRPDPRGDLDRIEKLNTVRAKQDVPTQPYIFALEGEVAEATHALADELGSRLRTKRSPTGARYRPWEATVRVDGATFNDPQAFQKILDEQASAGRGAMLYLPDLANVRPDAPGFKLMERHIERFGGINPLILAGTASQIESLQGALPTVVRKKFDVRGLDGEQAATLIEKIATDEGFELSTEAAEALAAHTPGGSVKGAQKLWRRIKTAHANRLGSLVDFVENDPRCVYRVLATDVMAAVEDRRTRDPLDELDEMVGLAAVKAEVQAIVDMAGLAARGEELGLDEDRPRLNLLFAGNPGTGKTTVAELLAEALHDIGYLDNASIAKVRVQDLTNGNPQQNVRKLFEENKGGVIFVDELHQLMDTEEGKAAFRAMIPYLGHKDYLDTVFIGAGYPGELRNLVRDLDDGAERRFTTVPFEDYETDELGAILDVIANRRNKNLDADAREAALDKLERQRRKMKHFGNGGSVDSVVDAALKKQRTRLAAGGNAKTVSKTDFTTLIAEDFADAKPVDRDAIWAQIDALNGLEDVKEQLRGIAAMVELAEAQGRSPLEFVEPYFIFRGPPGAGRDQVASLMARLLNAYDLLPTSEMVQTQGAKLQGRFVGHTTGDVEKIFESAWGGMLVIDQIGGLAEAGGAFKEDAVKEIVRQMKDNRGRFGLILADDDEGIDAMLDLDDELTALLGETIVFGAISSEDAAKDLLSRLDEGYDVSGVADLLAERMEELAEAPRWAGFEDARAIATQIVKAHAAGFIDRRKKGEKVDPNVILPDAVEAAFAAAIKEKRRRGEAKTTTGDGLDYAAEVKVKTKTPKASDQVKEEKMTKKDERLLKAMAKVDLEFAALFDADEGEQVRQEADVNSDYIKRIAEELGVKAETAVKNLEAVKVKIQKLVTTETVVKHFEYHCPYCGGVDSPSCGYMNRPIEWKIQHSLKKPWEETITETKMVESEV